jgi:hypothetical protein
MARAASPSTSSAVAPSADDTILLDNTYRNSTATPQRGGGRSWISLRIAVNPRLRV